MKIKKCKNCNSYLVKKFGFKRGKQRYKCNACGYIFQNKSRKRNDNLREEYTLGKQTYQQLSTKYGKSIPTIQKRLDNFLVKKKK